MFQYRKFCIAFLVALACLTGAAFAQTSPWQDGLDWLAPRVVVGATAGAKIDSVKAKAQMLFINSDLNGKTAVAGDDDASRAALVGSRRRRDRQSPGVRCRGR